MRRRQQKKLLRVLQHEPIFSEQLRLLALLELRYSSTASGIVLKSFGNLDTLVSS